MSLGVPLPVPMHALAVALALTAVLATAEGSYVNNWQGPFQFRCPSNQVLSSFYSIFSGAFLDRRWMFACRPAPLSARPTTCQWSETVSSRVMSHVCAENQVLVGVRGEYDTQTNDRGLRFECCEDADFTVSACQWTDYRNVWEGVLDYTVPASMVVVGTSSLYSEQLEDRRHRFRICSYERRTETEN
ncbi:hypothetical protein EGW08_009848 [Elysia chlorotica]|uniref:Dermatopontin n=1 Tax=Elysia chlorotica TaxID=188477 RepID=A0A3S0ZP19_ELYCH|nr:hypothetical protein EGW08_009848 [Elysia chlorotica]